ncbi:MAG: Stf0 family sulfotransferase [Planctomycetaceae bacterium]
MRQFLLNQAKRIQLRSRLLFTRPTQFIIVSNGRSGSNLLLSLLASHPRVKHCGEYYTDNRMKEEDFTGRDLLAEFQTRMKRRGFEKAVGAKFLYYQLEPSYAERFNAPALRQVQSFVLSNLRFKVIHLTRRNLLRTVISMLVAAKTGVYRAHDRKELPTDAAVEVCPTDCIHRMQLIRKYEDTARQWFRHHQVLEMTYEDLVSNQDSEISRLLKFLHVDDMRLQGRMVRQSRSLKDSVANYEELAKTLAGTQT